MSGKCKVKIKDDIWPAKFYGVFQISKVLEASLIRGGHGGGVIAFPVAVVDYGDGPTEVSLSSVYDIEEDPK